jgi:hypothetical protein
MANLRKRPGSAQELFDQAFQAVKAGRNKMEAEFIRIVS